MTHLVTSHLGCPTIEAIKALCSHAIEVKVKVRTLDIYNTAAYSETRRAAVYNANWRTHQH